MSLKLIRVDDRLIHGQVVESWLPHLAIEHIVVVSDEISKDETRKTIMRFSAPDDVKLSVFATEEAAARLGEFDESEINTLVLLPGLEETIELLDKGVLIKELNIGGMHYSAGRTHSIGKAIFLSKKDNENLKNISKRGIKIEGKGIPTDEPVDLIKAAKI